MLMINSRQRAGRVRVQKKARVAVQVPRHGTKRVSGDGQPQRLEAVVEGLWLRPCEVYSVARTAMTECSDCRPLLRSARHFAP